MSRRWTFFLSGLLALAASMGSGTLRAQERGPSIDSLVEARQERLAEVALEIWDFAEVGYQEVRSSALLQGELASAGFSIEAGVAGMPTAFVAEWGSGSPVIGILAEFDALPGITQDAVPERAPLPRSRQATPAATISSAQEAPGRPWRRRSGWRPPGHPGPSGSTGPLPRKAGREKSTWSGKDSSKMWTWSSTGMRGTTTAPARPPLWRTSRPSSGSTGSLPMLPAPPIEVARPWTGWRP